MKPIEWLPIFEIGVKEIDDDHRGMFDLLGLLYIAAEQNCLQKCSKILDRFLKASLAHFENEEEFLRRVRFPGVEEHKKYHKQLLSRASEARKLCDENMRKEKVIECYLRAGSLLIDDILRGDVNFKSFLDHHGLSRRQD